MHTVTCICPPQTPTPAEAKPSQPMLPTPPVKSPCISTRLLNAYGNMYSNRQTTTTCTDAHTTYCHTYIHREVRTGGKGPAPSPCGSQAKPCCQARPTGSPCISRCHLNAYGQLYLSPSNTSLPQCMMLRCSNLHLSMCVETRDMTEMLAHARTVLCCYMLP